ncbi:type II toxin-antitoxin system PemK/MazF family toxin [Nodosilinea sp. LEGE 07298]|uniref:type II toxin-antitoxin system PemK/MazF family toxin n=1 Tax=Nodosilinea sp. LEGE 07298 TaxID=2777970 RepID=UPI001880D490|nr:type II toxin-antitoxin system PemK/MazF family toxin [Nodosilinea sp. LEGE 07298]MBE9114014.1 type II toxin-antitoxin system PemK/MazF family toxin [Nodosilinea sp. LEGE 07298]
MAAFVKDDVVVLPFPFSDLSDAKRRPALVVATLPRNDLILCMITSQSSDDSYSIAIAEVDFTVGGLNRTSYIKANRVFTANARIIAYKADSLATAKTNEVIDRLVTILRK